MNNVHLAPSVTLFRAPPAKGVRRPPPPEGIAFETLSDSEVFQSLDDILQKERNGTNLTSYEKFRKQVDPLLDNNSNDYENALTPLMSHFGVVQKVLKTRVANMLDAKYLSSNKGLNQMRNCTAPAPKGKGK